MITTSPGAVIGADTDTLPARFLVPRGEGPAAALSTGHRLAGIFVDHGIDSGLLAQLEHIQQLALAINLQGRYHISTSLMGLSGHQDFSLMGKTAEAQWTDKPAAIKARMVDIRPGNADAMRYASDQLASAAADLTALLEEATQ